MLDHKVREAARFGRDCLHICGRMSGASGRWWTEWTSISESTQMQQADADLSVGSSLESGIETDRGDPGAQTKFTHTPLPSPYRSTWTV